MPQVEKGTARKRASGRPALTWTDLVRDSRRQFVLGFFEIVVALQAEPEFSRRAKIASEPKRGIRRDGAITLPDFLDPIGQHARVHRESMNADTGGDDEILVQDLAGEAAVFS